MRLWTALLALALLTAPARGQVVADLEDLPLSGPNTFYNGADGAGGFTSRGARFNNSYNATFGAWEGWAYSNVVNTTTPGFTNQYAAYNLPGGGGDGSPQYAVAFAGVPAIDLPANTRPQAVRITNTTYAALSMRDGDAFAKKFGGPTGNDPDFFRLTVEGRDAAGALLGSLDFYLADYRFSNNSLDYIVSQWTTVDLTGLPAGTRRLTFALTSSDNGQFGMT